jgi:drug/metabolite transporter (DMT)-like permease
LVLIRFVVGLVGVASLFLVRRKGPRVPRPWHWALRGLFGGLAVYFYFLAIEQLGVGPATVLNYSAPIHAALFGVLFLRERVTPHLASGLLVATCGAALVVTGTLDFSQSLRLGPGVLAGLASAVFSGAAMAVIRSLRSDTDAATVFFSFCLFGSVVGALFSGGRWEPLTPETLWPALGVGVLSLIAQLLFTHAFADVTAAVGAATTQLTPAISWVLAVWLLGEPVKPLTALGAFICVAGVLWGVSSGRSLANEESRAGRRSL